MKYPWIEEYLMKKTGVTKGDSGRVMYNAFC